MNGSASTNVAFLTGFVVAVFAGQTTLAVAANLGSESQTNKLHVFVGTYTRGESKGIYRFEFDPATGAATQPELAAETEDPSFLAIHPSRKFLFAVNEIGEFGGKPSGAVSAFSLDAKNGQLQFLNQQPSLGGAPCHLVVDKTGKNVLLANYSGGSVAVLPIGEDGRLAEASSFIQHEGSSILPRQKGPHGHSINLDAANRFAFAADLGLDKVVIYRFDAKNRKLTPNEPAFAKVEPGSGPRHFDFHPSGKFAYVINEISSTVTSFAYDSKEGKLTSLNTVSTLPKGFEGNNSTADIHAHPSGKFVYGSNRGHDSIAIFAVEEDGRLSPAGHEPTGGKTPRNFALDPSGKFLFAENQNSNTVVVFRVNADTGDLKRTDTVIDVPSPVCVQMVPAG